MRLLEDPNHERGIRPQRLPQNAGSASLLVASAAGPPPVGRPSTAAMWPNLKCGRQRSQGHEGQSKPKSTGGDSHDAEHANMAPLTVAPKGSFRRNQSVAFMLTLIVA